MAGETSDAISAYTQVKMAEASRLLPLTKEECPEILGQILLHDTDQKSWDNTEDPVERLERNFYGHPLTGLLWERKFEEVLFSLKEWANVPTWECLQVHKKLGLSFSVYVDERMAGKKQNMDTVWTLLQKATRSSRSSATHRSSVFGLHAKRGTG